METWLMTSLLLCLYGFFKEFRPSEPFLTEYLTSPPMNLTLDETYNEVYPVWTYAYLSLLIIVFLLTDLLRYKPMIIFESIGYVATWCLLLWARGVRWMQFMQFCYGIASSTEVAYYTYIYSQVSSQYYQKVTSFTRTAILCGRFISGLFSQVLTTYDLLSYHDLNYVSLASVSVALFISCVLPSARSSIYFHREQDIATTEGESSTPLNETTVTKEGKGDWVMKVIKLIWSEFKEAYRNKYILKWCIWWAFATCGNLQVGNYIQPLWETIAPKDETENLYNGIVEATSALLCALSAFAVGYIRLNWSLFGEGAMAVISLIDGLLLLSMGLTHNIWVGYINYILFRASYQFMITIASFQVAKKLRTDSYGLIFGINMFVALLLQSILTATVVQGLLIEPKLQFVIYGGYFGILACFFFILSAYTCGRLGLEGMQEMGPWEAQGHDTSREPLLDTAEPIYGASDD